MKTTLAFVSLPLTALLFLGACASTAGEAPAPAEAPEAQDEGAADTDPVQAVLERYRRVSRIRELVDETHSIRMTGVATIESMGIEGAFEVSKGKPNLSYTSMELGAAGQMKSGFEGTAAWLVPPMMGPMILEGTEALPLLMEAPYDTSLYEAPHWEEVTYVGFETRDGILCDRLRATVRADLLEGDAAETASYRTVDLLFARDSGLLVAQESTQDTMVGEVSMVLSLEDYQEVEGYLFPMLLIQDQAGVEVVVVIDHVEFNTLEPEDFAAPAEIQALLEEG